MNYKYILFGALLMSLVSCQDVIILDLQNAQIKPVIVGEVNDVDSIVTVTISNSQEFYDSEAPIKIDDATVTITDENGMVTALESMGDGVYTASSLRGQRGQSYTLRSVLGEQEYLATATIPTEQIQIDSIGLQYEEETLFRDEGIYPTIYFNDPPAEGNYYRIRATVNGQLFDFNADDPEEDEALDTNFNLSTDKFTNDGVQEQLLFYNLQVGDVLVVELQHLDRVTYDYLRTLEEVTSAAGVAPADPLSNFGTDALGYFGAYSASSFSITVE